MKSCDVVHYPLASNNFPLIRCLCGVVHLGNRLKIIQIESIHWKATCGKVANYYIFAKKGNTSVCLMKVSLLGLFRNRLATPCSKSASIITRARNHCCSSTFCCAKCKTSKKIRRDFCPRKIVRSEVPFIPFWVLSSVLALFSRCCHQQAPQNLCCKQHFPCYVSIVLSTNSFFCRYLSSLPKLLSGEAPY